MGEQLKEERGSPWGEGGGGFLFLLIGTEGIDETSNAWKRNGRNKGTVGNKRGHQTVGRQPREGGKRSRRGAVEDEFIAIKGRFEK